MKGRVLGRIDENQRDLGVQVQRFLKVTEQVGNVIGKFDEMLAFISLDIEYRSREIWSCSYFIKLWLSLN